MKNLIIALVATISSTVHAMSADCDPNYDPCVPVASDVDCAFGSGNGPVYVEGPVRERINRDVPEHWPDNEADLGFVCPLPSQLIPAMQA